MILLRHGQSEFNLHFTATRKDPGIRDPSLTPLGQEQAEQAASSLAREGIRRIVVSPYTRTLQTAVPVAQALGVPVIVNPLVRERFAFSCDIGTPRTELALTWPHDFSALDEVWWPPAEEPADQLRARAKRFRAEMESAGWTEDTLVVTHWGFILALTGMRLMNGEWVHLDSVAPE